MTRPIFRPILRPILLALVLIAAAGAAWSPDAIAEDCPEGTSIVLTLPDDQESLTCTIEDWHAPLVAPGYVAKLFPGGFVQFTERTFRISGSGPIEVIFALQETREDEGNTPGDVSLDPGGGGGYEFSVDSVIVGTLYREVVEDPDGASAILALAMTGAAGQSKLDAHLYARDNGVDLKVIVRRLPRQCSMWARVTGDVSGTFYGDVAYYLTSTTGVLVDPEQMGIFRGWMGDDMADEFAKFLAEELQDPDYKKDGKKIKGAEKFLLTLQDFKLDQETDDALEVFGILAGQFSLGITADLVPSEDPKKAKLLIDEVKATVGALDEGDRILFESIEAGEPALTINQYEGTDLAYGTFSGDLTTRGKYSLDGAPSRRLRVHIEANYTALRGQYTCAKR